MHYRVYGTDGANGTNRKDQKVFMIDILVKRDVIGLS